jgi:hypothetical protein
MKIMLSQLRRIIKEELSDLTMSRSELAIIKKAAKFIKANKPLAEYEEMTEREQSALFSSILDLLGAEDTPRMVGLIKKELGWLMTTSRDEQEYAL